MKYHLFLQYGWFLQNLGKDVIQTNMHMSVHKKSFDYRKKTLLLSRIETP